MKKVLLINLILFGIGTILGLWMGGMRGIFIAMGVVLLILSFFNVLLGLVFAIASSRGSVMREQGRSMLLIGAISLLCSCTLCSTGTLIL